MKKLLIALAAVLVTAATYAQGTINFNTRFTAAGVNAPVMLSDGTNPGPAYSAALYLKDAGGALTLLPTSVTTFRDAALTGNSLARYINPVEASVPGTVSGPVTVVMRAWLTSQGSYDTATFRGQSGDLVIATLGNPNSQPPGTPGDLPASFQGFTITVPEPSTIALGLLGAAALLIRRRK